MTIAPAWFREIYPAFAKAQRQAWDFLQAADDEALMAAFEAARAASGLRDVEAKRVKTLRARLGKVSGDVYRGTVLLYFWLALKLDARRGEEILRGALAVKPKDAASLTLRPHLVLIAAKTFLIAEEVRAELLDGLVAEDGNPRDDRMALDLGRALAARPELSTEDILSRAEALASGNVAGPPAHVSSSLWIACVALLARERAVFAPVVKELAAQLGAHLGAQWKPLIAQCLRAVVNERRS